MRACLPHEALADGVGTIGAYDVHGVGDPLRDRRVQAAGAVHQEVEQEVGGRERARGEPFRLQWHRGFQNASSACDPSDSDSTCQCMSRRPSSRRNPQPWRRVTDAAADPVEGRVVLGRPLEGLEHLERGRHVGGTHECVDVEHRAGAPVVAVGVQERGSLEQDDRDAALAELEEHRERVAPESMTADPRVTVDAADERSHRIVGPDITEASRQERQEPLRHAVDVVDHDGVAPLSGTRCVPARRRAEPRAGGAVARA